MQSAQFCTSYLAHSSYLGKNKVHTVLLLLQHAAKFTCAWEVSTYAHRKALNHGYSVTKIHRTVSDNKRHQFNAFPVGVVVNVIQFFYFEPCKPFLASKHPQVQPANDALCDEKLIHATSLPRPCGTLLRKAQSATGEHKQGKDSTPSIPKQADCKVISLL